MIFGKTIFFADIIAVLSLNKNLSVLHCLLLAILH
jgi:hypothetical protein